MFLAALFLLFSGLFFALPALFVEVVLAFAFHLHGGVPQGR